MTMLGHCRTSGIVRRSAASASTRPTVSSSAFMHLLTLVWHADFSSDQTEMAQRHTQKNPSQHQPLRFWHFKKRSSFFQHPLFPFTKDLVDVVAHFSTARASVWARLRRFRRPFASAVHRPRPLKRRCRGASPRASAAPPDSSEWCAPSFLRARPVRSRRPRRPTAATPEFPQLRRPILRRNMNQRWKC